MTVPLELPDDLEPDEIWVRSLGQIPVFRLVPATQGDDQILVTISESSRRAAAAD